jgi:predicted transcriptional regulator
VYHHVTIRKDTKHNNVKNATREALLVAIEQNPGICFRDACRYLKKEIGVTQYHVRTLIKAGIITCEKDGRYTRYYAKKSRFDPLEMNILSSWRRPVEREILKLLSNDSFVNVSTVASSCNMTIQAVTWHVKRMKINGLIDDNTTLISLTRDKINSLSDRAIITI